MHERPRSLSRKEFETNKSPTLLSSKGNGCSEKNVGVSVTGGTAVRAGIVAGANELKSRLEPARHRTVDFITS